MRYNRFIQIHTHTQKKVLSYDEKYTIFFGKRNPPVRKIYEMFMKDPKRLTEAVDGVHAAMLRLGK